jgi:hypothetical protein
MKCKVIESYEDMLYGIIHGDYMIPPCGNEEYFTTVGFLKLAVDDLSSDDSE